MAFEKAIAVQHQQEQQLANGQVSEIDPRADQLNQQALRFYESGQRAEADAAWEEALTYDPQHPETIYNQGILQWRRGLLTDELLLEQF